jgi:hypothetical protein
MDDVLAKLAVRHAFSIVQIGAYVGDTSNDPLYRFLHEVLPGRPQATVVLVEPVAEYFERLKEAYEVLPAVRLEQVAIAEQDCERPFYRLGVDPAQYGHPEWLSQLGSLRATRHDGDVGQL